MERTPWIERKFTFDYPEGWIFNILERLHGTAPRMKVMIKDLSQGQLIQRTDNAWSIQEHIGHLLDLEELHAGRIDDFIARKETLRPADMGNKKTFEAQHNNTEVQLLLNEFKNSRDRLISRMAQLDDESQKFKSLHPRLQMMMRPVDMAFFTAEHDDHHLASIRSIITSNENS